MSVVIFFIVLFALILVHEWGHFIVAKKTGMRVDEFGIGFPPKLFGIKKGETEYTFNLLPIGGFVRIFGENAQDAADSKQEGKDISSSFTSKSKWAQAAVLLAGVTMNIIFAWLLIVVVFLMGVPTSVEEGMQSENARLVVTDVVADSPAAQAGILPGAEIRAYGDAQQDALIPSAFRNYTASSEGQVTLAYAIGEEEKSVTIEPQTGILQDQPDQKVIGIHTALVETVYLPFHEALLEATITTWQTLSAIVVGIGGLFRDIVMLDADLSQVAGPVGIVGLVGDAAEFGLASLLMFTAIISLNLAVINLLPFPALDGGRLLFVGIEAITRKDIDPVWVSRLNVAGFILLMALMLAVTYSDISKLL